MSALSDLSIQQHTPAPLRLELKASFRVSPQELFKTISDQHAVASWVPLMQAVSMEHRQGGHGGECGVGSVRHCTLHGMGVLDETIVWWNPPHGYAFRVAAQSKLMMPTADHVSVMLIAPGADGGSTLTWRHYFNWRGLLMRHLAAIMLPMIMKKALGNIRKDLDAADASPAAEHCGATQCQKSCCK